MSRSGPPRGAGHAAGVLGIVGVTLGSCFIPGCGSEVIPIPIPCPACTATATAICDTVVMPDGTRLRAEYSPGEPGRPLIIAVPGFGGSYLDVGLVFPKGLFPTLSLSLPGNLCSDRLPPGRTHTIAAGTEAVEALLEHYADLLAEFGEDKVLLVGASFGGLVVADYFAKHPASEMPAVIIASQDTPLSGGLFDAIGGYLQVMRNLFPLVDNTHLQEYLASSRTFDVSAAITQTRNRWLIIDVAEDDLAVGSRAMAERLGERARRAVIPGNHFTLLVAGESIRQAIDEHLGFLLRGEP